jgi:hypothetical protein
MEISLETFLRFYKSKTNTLTPKFQLEKMETATSPQTTATADNPVTGHTAITDSEQHEEIAWLAYQYYEERERKNGSPEDDWYRAEEEIRRRLSR